MSLDARLWGKAAGLGKHTCGRDNTHSLICHLLDTAAVAEVVWDELLTAHQRSMVAGALRVPDEEARALAAFWAGLHDIGKISVPFQLHRNGPKRGDGQLLAQELSGEPGYEYAPGATQDKQSHEAAAHWWLVGTFQNVGYPSSKRRPQSQLSHAVAQLLGGHGGRYQPVVYDKDSRCPVARHPGLGTGSWEEQRRIHFDEVRRVTGAKPVPAGRMSPGAAVVLTGVVTLADWLASLEEEIQTRLREDGWAGTPEDLDAYWRIARTIAPRLLQQTDLLGTGFAQPPDPVGGAGEAGLGASIANQLPELVAEHGPGLVIVTAPPSEERTEAALRAAAVLGHAAHAQGLFYALPTGSAADSHMAQVHAFAGQALTGPRRSLLLHSSSRLKPAEAAEQWARASRTVGVSAEPGEEWALAANSWLNSHHRALLASLGTGSVDELLQAVMPVQFNVMRLFAFSGKVVVVDEAHARGAWGQKLMLRFLQWAAALRIPVVLAATVADKSVDAMLAAYRRGAGGSKEPAAQPRRLPGWSFVDAQCGSGHLPEQPVEAAGASTLSIVVVDGAPYDEIRAALALMAATGDGSVVVYRSTPAEAIRTFRWLTDDLPGLDVTLIHEQMRNKDRWQRLAACRSASSHGGTAGLSVLVTTPMLQHARGLRFNLVVSGPAPLVDLLARAAQSAGDQQRLVVLGADSESELDDAALVRRTATLLGKGRTVVLPEELPLLLDEVYADELVDRLEESAARELRQLDNRRTVRERRASGTASWLGVPGPWELDGDLGLLSRAHPGMESELLSSVLGEKMVHVVCLYPGHDEQGKPVYLLEEGVLECKLERNSKGRPRPGQLVPYLIPVPERLVEAVKGDASKAWRDMAALKTVLRLNLQRENGKWVHTGAKHRFHMSELGLIIDQLP
ncbi:CRISPR-associated endonuclease Cas3'' [Streptomyces griseoaurantiacus]|uniref:CRISPR-associated endonuclease Cas3 n=1 Tax=Streptomyces griseoaurantiacus TaxID=68213 RepID=A0A7W2DWN1_9ACTN|nr:MULTISPECIES: CRISPR-associated endonuclease Cas3'' [Streptomyces]MBA5224117.1 CRISPR-associated endonuclease Cas3'' [Streptomyces griseoaurantiacus]